MVACLAAAVADSDPVGSFVAGVDVGGDGGGSGGYFAPVSARLAASGVVTAGSHVRSDGSCRYGRWSDGSCRACPSGQVWISGRGCVRAESRTSCSSGNSYFSQWNGCRPSSCPHGRSSTTGRCRSAPVVAATTTTAARPVTTAAATTTTVRPTTTTTTTTAPARPASCGNRGRRPDGTCRACPALDEYHNGSKCVKKTKPARGDPKCSVAGEVYYSGYRKCLPSSCELGRTSAGECRLAPPSGVEADGDSRGLYPTEPESDPVNGQIVVSWSAVSGATGYVVGYALDSSSLSWRERSVSGTSVTLGPPLRILLDNLYHIRVKAVNGTGGSGWSDTVFSFPTYTPATGGDNVGIIPINGFRLTANYDYVFCTNTAPVSAELNKLATSNPALTRDMWQGIIRDGVEIWDTKVEYITVGVPEMRRCTDEERDVSEGDVSLSLLALGDTDYVNRVCERPSFGCVAANGDATTGRIDNSAIFLRNNISLSLSESGCSNMSELVMHESGHVFGLGDHVSRAYDSVMYDNGFLDLCAPTEYDIGAMKAIYQSRSVSTDASPGEAAETTVNLHNTAATTTTSTTTTTTSTTVAPTTASSTTTTTLRAQPVTVWQIETRPTRYDPPSREIEFTFTSGNTFTYAGRAYTISAIKTYNRAPRIQATPDLEDHELPGRTLIRFWPTDSPSRVQTIRLSDGGEMEAGHRWDLIWPSRRWPIDINRNTTWHIDLTIPAEGGS